MSKIYLWAIPESYPDKHIGIYNDDTSPDCFLFKRGHKVDPSQFTNPLIVEFNAQKQQIEKYDCLINSSILPLINPRLAKLLLDHAKEDIQLIDATVKCTDGELKEYKILNFIQTVKSIDHKHSVIKTMDDGNNNKFIVGFKRLVCKPSSMGNHLLAREAERKSTILVSQTIYDLFKKEKIKGVQLYTPAEYYSELYPGYS